MPDEAISQVHAWFAAWNARDFESLRGMYSPAAAYLRPDGFSQGAEAIVSYLRTVAAEIAGETAIVDAVICGQGVVAVEWSAQAGSDDARTRARMASFFRFQDGKILSQHEFGDPTRSVRLLTARWRQAASSSPMASPGETMVTAPSPLVAVAPSSPPIAEPDSERPWPRLAVAAEAELRIEAGPDTGLTIVVSQPAATLGRALDNDFVLRDPCVSGHHARLEMHGDQVAIVDLGSTNGTSVNGMQVQRSELQDGDRVTLGGNLGRFVQAGRTAHADASLQPISA
ncbi:MAG TPA: FHA domain-containing protein [Candidatus Dormibacteraeota bacterium]